MAHAFLLETDDIDECYNDVIEIVKKLNCPYEFQEDCKNKECNLCKLINANNLPSLITISPIKQVIVLDDINYLLDKFSTIPVYSKFNIYIIKEAHKLNMESANALLKFLEEPTDNILGFFITNNKENVISTIRSRCQLFYCTYNREVSDKINEDILLNVKLYLNSIYHNKDDLLYNRTHMINLYDERKEWEEFFYTMFYYLKDCCFGSRDDKIDMIKKISKESLIQIILLIETIIKYIDANGNIDLILDKFVIEMRKYYE